MNMPVEYNPALIEQRNRALARFLFQSFYFSQGDASLQGYMYNQVGAVHRDLLATSGFLRPDLDIADARLAIAGTVINNTRLYITESTHGVGNDRDYTVPPSDTDIHDEVMRQSNYLLLHLTGKRGTALDTEQFTKQLLARDWFFLKTKGGRPHSGGYADTQRGNRFLSHVLHYGLLEAAIGEPVCAHIFKEQVKPWLLGALGSGANDTVTVTSATDRLLPKDLSLRTVLEGLATVHAAHNPDSVEPLRALTLLR